MTRSESSDGGVSPGAAEMPSVYEKKSEVLEALRSLFKKFVKRTKCAQCGVKCLDKRFAQSSVLIVETMLDVISRTRCMLSIKLS